LDLSTSQGELAKACVAERVSYLGLTLSDSHSTQVEMILTNFVVTLMQTEGSTFYRSDTVAQGKQQEQVTKGGKRKNENSKEERPKAKAKAKKNKEEQTKDDDKATAPDAGDDDDAEDGSDALPW
jgi:hypothetical protein